MSNKKLLAAVAVVSTGLIPLLSAVYAGTGNWESVQASAAWNYDAYRVERLVLETDVEGPLSFGDTVLVAEPTDSCKTRPCEKYDLSVFAGGMKQSLGNVPGTALSSFRFELNDQRLVYANQIDEDGDHYAVVERNLEDGGTEILVEDAFFSGAEGVIVLVDGDDIYFEADLNYNNSSVEQSGVYVWDAAEQEADIIGKHWDLRDEHLLDAQDGVALEMLAFASGNKQLWFGDTHNVNYKGMTRAEIPGTWTESDGNIVAARFLDNGTLEYFQYFTRYTFDPDRDTVPVRHEGEHLNWYRNIDETYQLSGDRLAWIDSEDTLFVSTQGTVVKLGTAARGSFLLEDNRVFWATSVGGKMYDFATKKTTDLAFAVTDTAGDAYVGLDVHGDVWYLNTATGFTTKVGYGTNPVISDEAHVYWRGKDNAVYEATMLPSAGNVKAVKTSSSNVVYLIEGTTKKMIPSESVYFSYFNSWNAVQMVSASTLSSYTDAGTAAYAPGTKAKFADSPKVYVVGEDGKLHWIASQTVAYGIYGQDWNKGIITLSLNDMANYRIGSIIEQERDVVSI